MALLFAMVLGADWIDDCALLRAGRTRRLLGGWMPAPSTLGTFLRAFTFGHVRQLDRLLGEALVRAWAAGAGPGDAAVGDRCRQLRRRGARRQEAGRRLRVHQAALGITRCSRPGQTPARCCTSVCGRGQANTQRGVLRFGDELIARVERAGANGVKLLRADSGFWNKKVIARLEQPGWQYSIGVRA